MDYELSKELHFNMSTHHEYMLSSVRFAVVVNVTELAIEGVLSEIMYADDLVLIRALRNAFKNGRRL